MALEDAKNTSDEAFTRQSLTGQSYENTFAGATSFLRRLYTKDLSRADIAVTGIPFDQAVTNRPGTRLGPRAIREASALQSPDAPYGWPFDVLSERAIVDYGDMPFDYAAISDIHNRIAAHVGGILDAGVAPMVMGGDHYISYPILRAMADRFGPISLIQFDAHSDTWQDDDFDRIDHGTGMYKAIKQGFVDPARSVQIGIRTNNPDTLGVTIIDAADVHASTPAAIAARVKEVVGDRPAYVSFDIDALDPAFAPGTGTPVWGGLSSAQAAGILRGLGGINIRGGDIVEVSPPFDPAGITAIAGAHVATEIICLLGWRMRHE